MSDVLAFLNTNAGALSALFSGVVTAATVVYAWLTKKLVDETRQMRQAQTEPRLEVRYRSRDEWINLIDICIRNTGLGPAHDVKFQVRALSDDAGATELVSSLQKLGCFRRGLQYLGPTQEFSSFWASLVDDGPRKTAARIEVVAEYKNLQGATYSVRQTLDLSELEGLSRVGEPPLLKLSKSVEQIQKDVHSLAAGSARMQVDVFTLAEREEERARLQARLHPPGQAGET